MLICLITILQVVVSADVALQQLFTAKTKKTTYADSERALMDDLKISPVNIFPFPFHYIAAITLSLFSYILYLCIAQADAKANVFSGDEESFAFDRTVSRLAEMQSPAYWQMWSQMSH